MLHSLYNFSSVLYIPLLNRRIILSYIYIYMQPLFNLLLMTHCKILNQCIFYSFFFLLFFLILYFESSGSLLYSGIVLEGLEFYSFYISFICEMNFYSRALLHTHTKLTTIFVTIELAS